MLTDNQLIDLMISEPSWEDVIVKIVAEEGMDPWSIDICRLADCFVEYLRKMETLDLRIPARFILVAAILLRMKSDILISKKRKPVTISPEIQQKESEIIKMLSAIPPLEPPVKRVPLTNVSINELISALKKAFEVKERRQAKKERRREVVKGAIGKRGFDLSERIEILLEEIKNIIKDIENNIEFSKLVKKWERKEIVATLLPLLHLSQDGKVSLKQEDLFKEIIIEFKGDRNEQEGPS